MAKDNQRFSVCIFERSSDWEGPELVRDIWVSVSAKYSHALCTIEGELTKTFPVVCNRKNLEKPQVQDDVEVRNPKTTAQLLEVLAKFEERYSYKKRRGSRSSDNVERRGWNERRMSTDDKNGGIGEILKFYIDRVIAEIIIGDRRNRGSSSNFSRGDQEQGGRLNILLVRDEQNVQSQSANDVLLKLSAICMSPVELPYVRICLNETFTKALWDTATRGLLATDHVILNHGQVTWTTPELATPSPNYHTTPTGGRFSSRQI
ncbi:uncharacterized protein TNCV_1038911 [Trichonephila clavipes]|uniref:Uncharacterized protein n=1 Tax=Trichonephila clavipes TaxID=2585209 RepID=A0A8X6VWA0_TRICX|nr:uncharacterized protein TNCV_1038911 [Trichonephila clavipes]